MVMERQLILEIACLLVTLYAIGESCRPYSMNSSHLYRNKFHSDGEDCETPDHWEGECIELKKCRKLLALKDSFRDDDQTAFLEHSVCRETNSSVYYCCRYEATDLLPDTRHCGQSLQSRIHGGSATHLNEYPWTALIRFMKINETEHYCGGTLINNRYVLTAASCSGFQKLNVIKAPVRLGEWDVTTDKDCDVNKNGKKYCADPHLDFGIEKFILHPNYTNKMNSEKHDIALIRLDRYVNFTEFIQPVCLPIQPRLRLKTYIGSRMVAVGWGVTAAGANPAAKQSVYMSGVNLDVCSKKIGFPIKDTHLCAGGIGTGICFGDAGGPLVFQQSVDFRVVYVLVGISSLVLKGCNHHGGASAFTRVGSYMDWIQENLKP